MTASPSPNAASGASLILFTFIATFSRSPTAENIVQNIIFVLLIAAAGALTLLKRVEGEDAIAAVVKAAGGS